MREKIKLSGVPETMLQTIYARAKESRGRGEIHDAKAEEIMICTPFTGHPVEGVLLCGTHMSTKGNV